MLSDCEIILAGNNVFTGIRTYCFWWNCSYYNLPSKKECLSRQDELCTVWDRYGNEGEIRWLSCPNCNKTASIRKGSFFEQSKLTLQKWLLLMHWWARQYPVTDAAVEVEVTEKTAIQVYQWLRDVCIY